MTLETAGVWIALASMMVIFFWIAWDAHYGPQKELVLYQAELVDQVKHIGDLLRQAENSVDAINIKISKFGEFEQLLLKKVDQNTEMIGKISALAVSTNSKLDALNGRTQNIVTQTANNDIAIKEILKGMDLHIDKIAKWFVEIEGEIEAMHGLIGNQIASLETTLKNPIMVSVKGSKDGKEETFRVRRAISREEG